MEKKVRLAAEMGCKRDIPTQSGCRLFGTFPLPSPGAEGGDYYFEVWDLLLVGDENVIVAYSDEVTSSNLRDCECVKRVLEAGDFKVTILRLPLTIFILTTAFAEAITLIDPDPAPSPPD